MNQPSLTPGDGHLADWVGLQATVLIGMDENCQVETLLSSVGTEGLVEIWLRGECGDACLTFSVPGLQRMREILNAAWDQVQAKQAE